MNRDKLIELIKIAFNDDKYRVEDGISTEPIYIKTYSNRLKRWCSEIKCYTYKDKYKVEDPTNWYLNIYLGGNGVDLLIPKASEQYTLDFLNIFKSRLDNYLLIKNDYDSAINSLLKLKIPSIIQSEIRDFKISSIGIDIENKNQE
jgi:hypothetical protein